jgi:hypothetical protein
MTFKKNKIAVIIFFIVVFFLILKITISIFQNTVLNIIKSEKFHRFLVNQIEYHLVTYANNLEYNQEKKLEIKESLKKIVIEWKPILEQIEKESK